MATLLGLFGGLTSLFVFIKYVLLVKFRINNNLFKPLYDIGRTEKQWVLYDELVDSKYPEAYRAICCFKDAPYFYIDRQERMLQAGSSGTDNTCTVTCFRFSKKKTVAYLKKVMSDIQVENVGIPVELITPWCTDRMCSLPLTGYEPLLDKAKWGDMDKEVGEVFSGKKNKSGLLLYGPPGNGKSHFVKYLATKYKASIKIVSLSPDYTNYEIVKLFSQITPNSIVLFEDFDNYFDGRDCIIGGENHSVKFSFDVILNCLDGVYTAYNNVVFIMTANDIDKIDYALYNRPSRFKYVREFDNPGKSVMETMLPTTWCNEFDNVNLDQIIRLKEFNETGVSLEDAKNKLNLCQSIVKNRDTKPKLERDTVKQGVAIPMARSTI